MPCLAAKPIVDGIEKDLQGKAEVIRIDLLSKIGRDIAQRYNVRSAPTIVVVDGSEEIYRHEGIPSRGKVVAQATG